MAGKMFKMQMTPATAPAFFAFDGHTETAVCGTAFAVSLFVIGMLFAVSLHLPIAVHLLVLLSLAVIPVPEKDVQE